MDFTIKRYKELTETLLKRGFVFSGVQEFCGSGYSSGSGKLVILRQDVDRLPENSLNIAAIQKEAGIKSTFYFRAVPQSFDPYIIERIAGMGHEVGYHYEDVSLAAKKRGAWSVEHGAGGTGLKERLRDGGTKRRRDEETERQRDKKTQYPAPSTQHPAPSTRHPAPIFEIAIESFAKNLEKLRKVAPVKTICMHGSPLSRWDSRLLWEYYDYHDFGIIGEPYFDIDFDEVLYLTDTGRRWDGNIYSIRDKPVGSSFAKASEDKGWDGDLYNIRDKGYEVKGARAQGRSGTEEEWKTGNEVDEISTEGENPYKDWKVKPVKYRLETEGRRDTETQGLREEVTKGLRDEGAKRRFDNKTSLSLSVSQSLSHSIPRLHSTHDIIKAANEGKLPDKIMMTFHPQRWTDRPLPWVRELIWQNVKNVGKYFLVKFRND